MNDFNMDMFDLNNLDDLNPKLKEQIEKVRKDEFADKIYAIFKFASDNGKEELSIDEVAVVLYRMYHEEKTREQVMNKLYQLATKQPNKKIESTKRKGYYKLIK